MAVLKNEFSWSRSREELFLECRRKYYFHYYGSWGGWEHESDARTREIYMLKNLKTRAGWAGLVIQDAVQSAVRAMGETEGGLFADNEAFIQRVIQDMREDFASSKRGTYRRNPKSPGLVEHEYEIPVEPAVWKANADHVVDCLKKFFASDMAARLRETPAEDFVEFKKFDSAEIQGIKVFAVPDICIRAGEEYLIIAPRSSDGRPESTRLKIACQILFLSAKKKIAPAKIRALDLDLVNGGENPLEFSEDELEAVRERIKSSSGDMRAPLTDAGANQAREEDFAPTDSDDPCSYCSFRKVCAKFAVQSPGSEPSRQEPAPADSPTPVGGLKGIKAL